MYSGIPANTCFSHISTFHQSSLRPNIHSTEVWFHKLHHYPATAHVTVA